MEIINFTLNLSIDYNGVEFFRDILHKFGLVASLGELGINSDADYFHFIRGINESRLSNSPLSLSENDIFECLRASKDPG
jgi:hypothetical protein